MELKITNKKEDPLLARTKIETEVVFDKTTPSREEIKSKLSKDLGKDEKLIVVKEIYTQYGLKKAKSLSYVYENEESLKRIEPQPKKGVKKKEVKAEEKKEEKQEAKTEKKEEANKEAREQPEEKKTEKEKQ